MWRPKDWKNPHGHWVECKDGDVLYTARGIYEAGADALWDALVTKYKVKMPPDFKSILLVIPEEEEC